LSQEATALYEGARDRLVEFINARSRHEIVFVRGTTEAINLVAQSYGRPTLAAGDEVLITYLEHHANIVPWQLLCEQTGAKLVVAPIDARGEVHAEAVEALMTARTRILAFAHVSNALGTILPVRRLIAAAKARGIVTLIDGAQAVPHLAVDVQALGCDFYAFSGHKLFGPTGIGVLYGREALLERMPPWQGGGDMILSVSFEKTTFNALPYKFEAGTPNIWVPSASARRSISCNPWIATRSTRTSTRFWNMRPRGSDRSRVCRSSEPPARKRALFRSWWRAFTRTTWAPFWTRTESP